MKPIALEPRRVESVVLACVALHNFLREKVGFCALYAPRGSFDHEDLARGTFTDGNWRPVSLKPGVKAQGEEPIGLTDIVTGIRGRQSDIGKGIRDILCEHFSTEAGEVP